MISRSRRCVRKATHRATPPLMTPETTADPRIAIQKSLTLGSFRSRGRSLSDALAHSLTRRSSLSLFASLLPSFYSPRCPSGLQSLALPVYAVLAVLVAMVWSAVCRWLAEYEQFAENAARRARGLVRVRPQAVNFPRIVLAVPPRRRFGLVVDSRPPPSAA